MTTVEKVTPAVVDLPTAAVMMGIGRTLAYRLAKSGEWPTPLIRVGRLIKVPTQPLLDYLNGPAWAKSMKHGSLHAAGNDSTS